MNAAAGSMRAFASQKRAYTSGEAFIRGSCPLPNVSRRVDLWFAGEVMVEPVSIDNVKAPGGGRIGLVHCPGTGEYGLLPERQQAMLDIDVATLEQWGAAALVTLLQPHEMRLLGVDRIGESARRAGLQWWHLPIADGCAPDASFETGWEDAGHSLHEVLDDAGRIVLHCRAGVGRTGTVAARLLIERGVDPETAVVSIRRARPGSIESPDQMAWVLRQFSR